MTYNPANDSGTGAPQQGFPFIIEGIQAGCEITNIRTFGLEQLVYYGNGCVFPVDVWCQTPTGTFIYQSGVSFTGNVLVVNGPLNPDSVYYLTPEGTPDPIDGSFSPQTIPTLGSWALIALVLLLLGGGVYFIRKRRMRTA